MKETLYTKETVKEVVKLIFGKDIDEKTLKYTQTGYGVGIKVSVIRFGSMTRINMTQREDRSRIQENRIIFNKVVETVKDKIEGEIELGKRSII